MRTFLFFLLLAPAFANLLSANNFLFDVNGCIQFSVSPGTGCDWMCSYCANQLGTNNYYFQDGVCSYQGQGCQGNPVAGKMYVCCSASDTNYLHNKYLYMDY
jgi:hypothetical protein